MEEVTKLITDIGILPAIIAVLLLRLESAMKQNTKALQEVLIKLGGKNDGVQ